MPNEIPRPEHPRPDFFRPSWINLNGEWDFAFDDGDIGMMNGWYRGSNAFDRKINVPFCYQSELSGVGDISRHDLMWYRKRFILPANMKDRTILLRFGAVDYYCDVYINGLHAGIHEGGYTPFSFEISGFLKDGENELCIRIADLPDCRQPRGKQNWNEHPFACWYTPTSGIWQSVWLEAAGDSFLTLAHITPDVDRGIATLELSLNRKPAEAIRADFILSTRGRVVRRLSMDLTERVQPVIFDMVESERIEGFSYWEPISPELYDLSIDLPGYDHVDTYFGMRKVEVKDGLVLLNNRTLYQRLVLDQGYWPKTDLCALHDYADTGEKLKEHFKSRTNVETHACDRRMTYAASAAPTGKEAFLVTEYGGIAFEEGNGDNWGYHGKVSGAEAFFQRYQSVTDAIRSIPYCQGYCYTQLTDVQQETNGILSENRKPKVDPERFRELNINPMGR